MPGKNIRLCNGRPLIYWALDALQGKFVDELIVSTDDPEIGLCINKNYIIKQPYRPGWLSTDKSCVWDLVWYHLQEIESKYDYVIIHHATSPLVEAEDFIKALDYLILKDADMLVSMCPVDKCTGVAKPIPKDGSVKDWYPKTYRGKGRQQLGVPYKLDGNIYIGKWDLLASGKDIWESNIIAYRMDKWKHVDIDTENDLLWADYLLRKRDGC